jgi:hypothetical protein
MEYMEARGQVRTEGTGTLCVPLSRQHNFIRTPDRHSTLELEALPF